MIQTVKNYVFGGQYSFGEPMTIVIDTRNVITGGSDMFQFKVPQNSDTNDRSIDFLVDFGDGNFRRILSKADASIPHTYTVPGIYEVNFYKPKGQGVLLSLRYETNPFERLKLLKVLNWGSFDRSRGSFAGCNNLDLSTINDIPNSLSTSMEGFLSGVGTTIIDKLSDFIFTGAHITSALRNMPNFNQDFTFNLPNCISLSQTMALNPRFNGVVTFNAPKLTSIVRLFENNHAFNQPLHNCGIDWSKITNLDRLMTKNSGASTYVAYNPTYYDLLLKALDEGGKTNVPLTFSSNYTSAGATARANLISKGWTITDRGMI